MPDPGRRLTVPLTLIALGGLVSLVAHQLAYLAAGPLAAIRPAIGHAGHDHLDHAHLPTQAALVVPVAAIAATVSIIGWARRMGLGTDLRVGHLGAVGASLFLAQESVEALSQTGGLAPMVSNPATFFGAVFAPVVAVLAVRLLRRASAAVARLLEPPPAPEFPDVRRLPRPADAVDSGRIARNANLARGPPSLVVLTYR